LQGKDMCWLSQQPKSR